MIVQGVNVNDGEVFVETVGQLNRPLRVTLSSSREPQKVLLEYFVKRVGKVIYSPLIYKMKLFLEAPKMTSKKLKSPKRASEMADSESVADFQSGGASKLEVQHGTVFEFEPQSVESATASVPDQTSVEVQCGAKNDPEEIQSLY